MKWYLEFPNSPSKFAEKVPSKSVAAVCIIATVPSVKTQQNKTTKSIQTVFIFQMKKSAYKHCQRPTALS